MHLHAERSTPQRVHASPAKKLPRRRASRETCCSVATFDAFETAKNAESTCTKRAYSRTQRDAMTYVADA
jgi:hypothetical protein